MLTLDVEKILQHFSCRSTTVGTLHAMSLQDFGYGDVVHQFEKRCITILLDSTCALRPSSSSSGKCSGNF